jgi:hypothetical protein
MINQHLRAKLWRGDLDERPYCLAQECSQRTMPLPHSDVLDRLTGFSRDLTSSDPVLLSNDHCIASTTSVCRAAGRADGELTMADCTF